MSEQFWKICQRLSVNIRVTVFPVMPQSTKLEIEQKIHQYDIKCHFTNKKFFNKILAINNTGTFEKIVKNCGCNNACNLFDGYLARCPVPMVVSDLNRFFGVNFLTDGKLNIYSVDNAEEVLAFLARPNKSCMNCSEITQKVAWKKVTSNPSLSDWLVTL